MLEEFDVTDTNRIDKFVDMFWLQSIVCLFEINIIYSDEITDAIVQNVDGYCEIVF